MIQGVLILLLLAIQFCTNENASQNIQYLSRTKAASIQFVFAPSCVSFSSALVPCERQKNILASISLSHFSVKSYWCCIGYQRICCKFNRVVNYPWAIIRRRCNTFFVALSEVYVKIRSGRGKSVKAGGNLHPGFGQIPPLHRPHPAFTQTFLVKK